MSDFISWLDHFMQNAYDKIEGWVDSRIFNVLKIIYQIQNKMEVRGGALEIGVHLGRFFIPLNAMIDFPEKETSFAIDLFSEQELNIDKSGCGNLEIFKENLLLYCRHKGKNVEIIQGDSTRLSLSQILHIESKRPKIISIDGGHTVEHTLNDLELASRFVSKAGAIFVDDIVHPDWIGVFEGVVHFLTKKPTIWPVLIGYNKILLVPMSVHHIYFQEFRTNFPDAKSISLCGYNLLSVK